MRAGARAGVWADVAHWPEWDVSKKIAPLIRLFAPRMRREIPAALTALGEVATSIPPDRVRDR